MANNQFLVSVAKAIARDPNTGAGIFLGKTNISSAFTLSMQKVEVRGGINNPLLYVYYHTRAVEIKVEDAIFNKTFLGLNVGQLTATGLVDVIQTECITLVGNTGTTTLTPLSDIAVYMNDGTIQNVTPTGNTFTVVGGGSTSVDVVYTINTTADQIAVATATPPSVVDMTLIAEVRDSTGVIVNYLQIAIPRFQISGNYTLSLAANGVSNQSLDGYALAVNSTDCTSGDYFAKVTWVPVASSAVSTGSIVAMPSTLTFPLASLPLSKNITVLGIRGTSNVTVTTSCSFVVGSSASPCFSAGLHTGVITCGSLGTIPVGTSGSVVVTYWDTVNSGSRTDWVNLIVT
jgi:hypothetical protein